VIRFLRSRLFIFLIIAAVAWFAYSGVTSLPLYMDDVIFGRYIEGVTLGELFTRIDLVPYYRPLSNAPWKLIMLANGGAFDPSGFHQLNLILHVLNGWLVAMLAFKTIARDEQTTWRRNAVAGLAALLYVLFPFSYQAVGWAAALGHVMATFGALLAANGVLAWRQGSEFREENRRAIARPYNAASIAMIWVGSAIAIFSHENGAATPFLVVMGWVLGSRFSVLSSGFNVLGSRFKFWGSKVEKNSEPGTQNRESRTFLVLLVPFLILALYVAIWWVLPKARPNGIAVSPADWLANAAYFVQGIGYPLAQIGAWTWKTFGLPREVVAAALGIVGGVVALLIAGKAGRVGVLWYVIAISVPTLLLQRAYVIDGPRLMLLASPGAALLWAAAVGRLVFNAEAQRNRDAEAEREEFNTKAQRNEEKEREERAYSEVKREGGKEDFIQEGEGKEFNAEAQRHRGAEGRGKRYRVWLARAMGVVLATVMLVSSGAFVGQRMGLHAIMSDIYDDMILEAYIRTDGGGVYINLPAWMAYRDEWYALGSEGITYITDYIGLRDLVYVNRNVWRDVEYASYPAAFPDVSGIWWDALRADRSAEEIIARVGALGAGYVTRFIDGYWGWDIAVNRARVPEIPRNRTFENGLTFLDAILHNGDKSEFFATDPDFRFWLSWHTESLIAPVSAFVHAVCDGELVAQADGTPLRGIMPFSSFAAGEVWLERRGISSFEQVGKTCVVRVGLYDPNTGERIPLRSAGEYVEIPLDHFLRAD
jgi:hypothetical protein